MLDRFLKFSGANNNGGDNHLDEDSLTAFIEGKISEKESPSIVAHLVNCSFCLHVTGELVKLSETFSVDEVIVPVTKEPTKVSEVLSGLISRIFGTADGAVFAHEERKEDEDEKES